MKLIKKIAAIMFALMMVFSLSTNAKAVTNSGSTQDNNTGTIKITNPKQGHTYKLYRILELDSFSYEDDSKETGNYSYRLRTDEEGAKWKEFIEKNAKDAGYIAFDDQGYVIKGNNSGDTDYVNFAKEAIKYANDNGITPDETKDASNSDLIEIRGLKLGLYAVDSTVGALCGLTTADTITEIQEKNEVPTIIKKVNNKASNESGWSSRSFANIGDEIEFKTTLTVQKGAENYILHDTLDKGFTLNQESIKVAKKDGSELQDGTDYTLTYNDNKGSDTTPCSFHIEFKSPFYNGLNPGDEYTITYTAILNKDAYIGHNDKDNYNGNKNTTWLAYGDSRTGNKITNTYTYQIPVFKYTMNGSVEKGLKDATFILSKDKQGTQKVSFVKLDAEGECDVYRVAIAGETGVDSITTNSSGKFKLVGLSDTYYLTETKAPKGYNKLTKPLKIYVSEGNSIRVDDSTQLRTDVKVLNKSGKLLPSTGGAGTTMIYLIGGALVLGSGIVLANKKRAKAK